MDGFDSQRHMRNLGFVPDECHIPYSDSGVPSLRTPTTNEGMRAVMSMEEWWAIENAAIIAHRSRNGDSLGAEAARSRGGYGDLGSEHFTIPDQRPLLDTND